MGANARWLAPLLMLGIGAGTPPVLAQSPSQVQELEERLSEVEERLKEAEQDESPWAPYISDFGGRIMVDQTWAFGEDRRLEDGAGNGELEDGSELRRARLFVKGAVAPWLNYKLQFDFSGGSPDAKDVYIQAHDLGKIPTIWVGNVKEPLSLQEQTSDKHIALMSRSMLADEVGSVGRNTGIKARQNFAGDRVHATLGIFNPTFAGSSGQTPSGASADGVYAISARLTSPLLYADDGSRLIHVGAFASHRNVDGFELGQEPEVHKTDDFIDGTVTGLDGRQIYGGELAGVFGPFHTQAEYVRSTLQTTNGPDPDIDTYYVQAGFFLTGESRPYDRTNGAFDRVRPASPFMGLDTGPGAWEVAARYSVMDAEEMANANNFNPASNDSLPGVAQNSASNVARVDVLSAGINWYPVSHAKWMLNFVHADQDDLGEANFVATRFQVDF